MDLIYFKNSHVRIIGYSLLLFSILIFLVTWVQWYVSIPASLLLIFAFAKLSQNLLLDKDTFGMSKGTLLILVALILAWVLISGIGGAFPQKPDMDWRNAIFHDLINYPWPVRYPDGLDSSLTYYLAFWIIPSIFGKGVALVAGAELGWVVANITLVIFATALITVTILLIISHLKAASARNIFLVYVMFVLFSGMDIIPFLLAKYLQNAEMIGFSIEWWTDLQYSSNTTQLCWVFNQAIPTWLVISLLLHEKHMNHFAFLGLMLLPYAPLPFLGVFGLMIFRAFSQLISFRNIKKCKEKMQELFSLQNVVAIATIAPIFYLYFKSNNITSNVGISWNAFYPGSYMEFLLFEFLILTMLIWKYAFIKPYFAMSVVGLMIVPLIQFGNEQDFCMRVSVPFLFVVMIYTMEYILQSGRSKEMTHKMDLRKKLLILVLIIGVATPVTEYIESYLQYEKAGRHCTSIYADKYGTLNNKDLERDNFISEDSSNTFFYRYLAKGDNQ